METFGVTYTHPEDVALTESAIKKVLMNPLKKSMAIYRFKRKTGNTAGLKQPSPIYSITNLYREL
jgi:hypothetical protein